MADIKRIAPRRTRNKVVAPQADQADRFISDLANLAGAAGEAGKAFFDSDTAKLQAEHAKNKEIIAKDRLKQAWNFEQDLDVDDDATAAGKQYHAILSANNAYTTKMDAAMLRAGEIANGSLDGADVLYAARVAALEEIDDDIIQDETYNRLMTSMFQKGASKLSSSVQVHKKALHEAKKMDEILKSLTQKNLTEDDVKTSLKIMDKYAYSEKQKVALLSGSIKARLLSHPEEYVKWRDFKPFGEDGGTIGQLDHTMNNVLQSAAKSTDSKLTAARARTKGSLKSRYISGEISDEDFDKSVSSYNDKGVGTDWGITENEIISWGEQRAKTNHKRATDKDWWDRIMLNSVDGGAKTGYIMGKKDHLKFSQKIDQYVASFHEYAGWSEDARIAESARIHSAAGIVSERVGEIKDLTNLSDEDLNRNTEEGISKAALIWSNYGSDYKAKNFSMTEAAVMDTQARLMQAGDGKTHKDALGESSESKLRSHSFTADHRKDLVDTAMDDADIDSDNADLRSFIRSRVEDMLSAGYRDDELIQDMITGYLETGTIVSEDGLSMHTGNLQEVAGKRGMNLRSDKVPLELDWAKVELASQEGRSAAETANATWDLDMKTGKAKLIYANGNPSEIDLDITSLTTFAAMGRERFTSDKTFKEDMLSIGGGSLIWEKMQRAYSKWRNPDAYISNASPSLISTPLLDSGFTPNADGFVGYQTKVTDGKFVTVNGIKLDTTKGEFGLEESRMKYMEDLHSAGKVNSKEYGTGYLKMSAVLKSYLDAVRHFEPNVLDDVDVNGLRVTVIPNFKDPLSGKTHDKVVTLNDTGHAMALKLILSRVAKTQEQKKTLSTIYYNIY